MAKAGDGRRVQMVEREVLQCVARHIVNHYQNKLPGLVNIARVKMPVDLKTATVFVSVIAPDQDETKLREEAADILQNYAGEIQRHVGAQLKLRFNPKLTFRPDHVLDKVLRVEGILRDISDKKKDHRE